MAFTILNKRKDINNVREIGVNGQAEGKACVTDDDGSQPSMRTVTSGRFCSAFPACHTSGLIPTGTMPTLSSCLGICVLMGCATDRSVTQCVVDGVVRRGVGYGAVSGGADDGVTTKGAVDDSVRG